MIWAGPTDSESDCTPYLNSVIRAISGTGDTVLEIPSGQFQFLSAPAPLPRMTIKGQGKLATVFNKRFDGGAMFYADGARGGGIIIDNLACLSYAKYAPGYFVYFAGNETHQPDMSVVRQCWVSSNDAGLWYINIVLDGIKRDSPEGLRLVLIEDCELFNAQAANIWVRDCVGLKVRGVGCFGGEGPNEGCGIYITGGPTANHHSTQCYFDDVNNDGQLNITNSYECSFRGSIGSLVTDGSHHWRVDASCYGAVHNRLINSRVDLW